MLKTNYRDDSLDLDKNTNRRYRMDAVSGETEDWSLSRMWLEK